MTHYLAYVLTEEAREEVIRRFPPKFPIVKAHHVTERFDIPADATMDDKKVTVIAYCCDESLETIIVAVGGYFNRPDGNIYHLTLSYDAKKGRESSQSNALIANLSTKLQTVHPFEIATTAMVVERRAGNCVDI